MFDIEHIDGRKALVIYCGTAGYRKFKSMLNDLMVAKIMGENLNIVDLMSKYHITPNMASSLIRYGIFWFPDHSKRNEGSVESKISFVEMDLNMYFNKSRFRMITAKPLIEIIAGDNMETAFNFVNEDESIFVFSDKVVSEDELENV